MLHRPIRLAISAFAAVLVVIASQSPMARRETAAATTIRPLPEFTHHERAEWLNSPPLTTADLRGKVTLIEFWTFACSNCRASVPWVKAVEASYADRGLTVIGVHTPELQHERNISAVADQVRQLGLKHPVMIDNDSSYWKALGNDAWPAFYLVDRSGAIRARFLGELHSGEPRAKVVEQTIESLLSEE